MSQYPVYTTDAPSVPAGSHQMRDYSSNQDPPRSSPYTAPSITPYLGLRSRLSQVWINRWTVLLLLVLARMLIASSGINNDLASSRAQALSACSNVESVGSAMASMPHFMSEGVNDLTAAGVDAAVHVAVDAAQLGISIVEEVAVIVIGATVGVYECMFKALANMSAVAVVNVLDSANQELGNLTKSLGDDMASVVSGFETAYNEVKDTLKSATLGISSGINLPDLNLGDDISKLQNLTLPSGLGDAITKMNNSLPDVNKIPNITDVVRDQFEKAKLSLNTSFGNFSFDKDILPVPAKEQLTFCSDNNTINDFFNNLQQMVALAKRIFIAVLAILAILACIPVAYYEIRRWRSMQRHAQLITHRDPMDAVYIGSRPISATTGIKFSNNIQSDRKRNLTRWVLAYATSEAALLVLALAIAGLFSCLCQLILLKEVEKQAPAIDNEVANFTNIIVDHLTNASQFWAGKMNAAITDHNTSLNQAIHEVFLTPGNVIGDGLDQFVNDTKSVIPILFGGTGLEGAGERLVDCLFEISATVLNTTLANILSNAGISLPLLPQNVFTAGVSTSVANGAAPDQSFLANPGSATADQLSNVVQSFINNLKDEIRTEAIISTCLLLVYLAVVLGAVIRAMTLWNGQDKVRGEGGAAPTLTDAENAPIDFRSDNQDRYNNFENNAVGAAVSYNAPAPRYSTAIQEKARAEAHWDADNKI